MDLAASASATAPTSNRPSSAFAAARRDHAVAVAVPTTTDLTASVSYVQGRSKVGAGLRASGVADEGRGGVWYLGTRLDAVG